MVVVDDDDDDGIVMYWSSVVAVVFDEDVMGSMLDKVSLCCCSQQRECRVLGYAAATTTLLSVFTSVAISAVPTVQRSFVAALALPMPRAKRAQLLSNASPYLVAVVLSS